MTRIRLILLLWLSHIMHHASSTLDSTLTTRFITRCLPHCLPPRGLFFISALPLPPSAKFQSYTSEPCPTSRESHGRITLTLHKSRTRFTLRRRTFSLELSSAQYPMVHLSMRPSTSIYLPLVCHSRDCDRTVLPMYRRVAPSHPLRKGGRQMGPCGLHRSHVLVCDSFHCDEPRHEIYFLRRQPKIC